MSIQTLFDNFDLLADAPNGVLKLRELILQLAYRGRLVPQDPDDEPGSILFEKIRLKNNGSTPSTESLLPVDEKPVPYEIPSSWEWVQLGDVLDYNGTSKVIPSEIPGDAWLLELEDIEKDSSRIIQRVSAKEREPKSTKSRFSKNDVLYGKLRPYLNKVVVADMDGYCTTEIVPLRTYIGIEPRYLMYALRRPDFVEYVNSRTYGTKMPRLGTEDGRRAPFPLPPLAEQHRIVAKVDQLMALCDELEVRQQARREGRTRLNDALLDHLLAARSADDFPDHWQRLRDSFDLVYDAPETIGKLRQAILQLAVQGKLVPQGSEDEPASVLLGRIFVDSKCPVTEQPLNSSKVQIPAPEGWEWQPFGALAHIVSGVTKGRKLDGQQTISAPYLRVANVQRGYLDLSVIKEIEATPDDLKKYRLLSGDVLLTEGGDWDKLGRAAVWEDQVNPCIHQNHVFRARLCDTSLSPRWVVLFMNSMVARTYFASAAKQTTNLASINMTQLRNCPVLVPPAAEQHRIVAKVDQLMALCDELERKLTTARDASETLMAAAAREVLVA